MKMLGTPRIYGDRKSSACVLAIGVFDGVHIGHRAIIEKAVLQARELCIDAVALTFAPHPAALLAPGRQPHQLTTLDHRARLLHSLGVASLVAWPFDAQFAALSPGDFEQDILRDYFHAKSIWVGENFTYGHKAAGNPSTLRTSEFLSEVEVNAQELYSTGTQVASSTVIRNDIESGDVYRAWQLLQRPHVVEGVVVDLHDDDYVFLLLMRHAFLLFMNTARSMRNRTQQKPQSFSIQRPSTSHNRQSTQSTRSSSKAARKMSAVIAIVSNTILFILNVLCIPNTHTF